MDALCTARETRRIGHTLRLVKSPFLLLALALAGCNTTPTQSAPPRVVGLAKDPVIQVKTSDARMNAAIAQARRELPTFKRYVAMPPSPSRFLEFKARFGDAKNSEHMWITHPVWNARQNTFSGTLANTPDFVKGLKLGQKVTIPEKDVSDWLVEFAPAGHGARPRALGGYTIRVLLQMEDEARAAKSKAAKRSAR